MSYLQWWGHRRRDLTLPSAVLIVLLLGFLNRGSQCWGGLGKSPTGHFLLHPRVVSTSRWEVVVSPFPSECPLWALPFHSVALPHRWGRNLF